jgi:hypothetical protein
MDAAIEFREHCKEVSKDELDMIIKAELFAHRRSGSVTEAKKHKIKERECPYQEFYFKGKRLCRQTFCYIHGIEKKKLLSIAKSLDTDGLSPRTHASIGKLPKHTLTFQDSERITTFLVKYAADNAYLSQAGCLIIRTVKFYYCHLLRHQWTFIRNMRKLQL